MTTYLNKIFTNRIQKSSINTIMECGSRDGLDAIELNNFYHPERIYSFECNPESILVCEENVKEYGNIKLVKKAVYKNNGLVDFYPTDMDKSIDKNIGASSLLFHRDNKTSFFQRKIQVEAIRLDTFMKDENILKIDLLCLDLQGAEHFAIEGLGKRIKDVHYIISEVSFSSFYHGDQSFKKIIDILKQKDFTIMACDTRRINGPGFGNALFSNMEWS
jgi:FkbM family methyltransferase